MRVLLVSLGIVLMSAGLWAQTGTATSYVLKVYQAGSQTATSVTVPSSAVQCNQARITGSNVNPSKWRWDDPLNAGRDCVFDDTARLQALADGSYEGTATAVNADGASAETARVPFVRRRPNPPAVLTGLRVTD